LALFQPVLSEELPKNATTTFIKRAASLLGPDVYCPALKHSCLALAFRFLTRFHSLERSKFHKYKAVQHLRSVIGSPECIFESDVFGAILLAQLSIMDECLPGAEILMHMNGCISMLEMMAANTKSISEEMRQYFDLLVFDLMAYVEPLTALRWMCSLDRLVFVRQSTFKRRAAFFRITPHGGLPDDHSAVLHTLAFLLRSIVAIIREFCGGTFSPTESRDLLRFAEDIKLQAQDPQFLRALVTFAESDIFANLGVDDQFPLQCMACIRLLISSFDTSTVLDAIPALVAEHAALSSHTIDLFRSSRSRFILFAYPLDTFKLSTPQI